MTVFKKMKQLMRPSMVATWGLLLIFMLVTLLSACTGSSEHSLVADGDGTEEYEIEDGDSEAEFEDDRTISKVCNTIEDCENNNSCDPNSYLCREKECENNSFCVENYSESYYCSEDQLCLPMACQILEDCPDAHYCTGGLCIEYPSCENISDMIFEVVTPFVRTGEQRRISAMILDKNGTHVPQPYDIEWTSMNSSVVDVQTNDSIANMAVAIGGETSGTTTIMATLNLTDAGCEGYELSTTISIQNFAKPTDDLRVIVTDSMTNETIGNATVMVNDTSAITSSENNVGVAIFNDVAPPYTIHVFHNNYQYKTLVNISGDDLLIPMESFVGHNSTAGLKTKLDLSNVPSLLRNDLLFGFMGVSFTQSLLDINAGTIFSSAVMREMPFPAVFTDDLALPSNVVIEKQNDPFSKYVVSEGNPGSTMAWAIGGFIGTNDMIQIVTERINDGWSDVGTFVLSGMSFSGIFYHGMRDNIQLNPAPRLQDNGNRFSADPFDEAPYNKEDLNGNSDTTDYIPNYDFFFDLSPGISLNQALKNRVEINIGELPLYAAPMDGIFTMVGARMINGQLVPMGIGNKVVPQEGSADKPSTTTVGSLNMNFAPHYKGLKNEYVVISYALPTSQFCENDHADMSYSAIIRHYNNIPSPVEMGDFIEFSPFASVEEDNRRFSFIPAKGANLHRVLFENNGRKWEIFLYGSTEEFEKVELSVPEPPGDDPFNSKVAITAADMLEGTSLDDLVTFNAKFLSSMDKYIKRYSVYHFNENKH